MITVKSYNGKMVSIDEDKKEEYLRNQERIKRYIKEGKTIEEVKEIMKNESRD